MNPYQQPYMYGMYPPVPMGMPMRPMMPYPPYGMPMMPLPMPMPQGPVLSAPPKPPMPMAVPIHVPKPVEQTTTVYVGKIPPTVEDEFIRKLLEFCGDVAFWRRVTDPTTGQLKGFAFCDFKSPEGVLRALRLLNGLAIDEHQLLLKVDEKNQKLLDAYIAKRNAEQHGKILKPGETIAQTQAAINKEKEEDDQTKTKVDDLVGRVHRVLTARRAGKDPAEEDIADGDPTKQDKNQLVSREIKNFRERQAQRDLEMKDRQREEESRRGGHSSHNDDRNNNYHELDRQKEIDRLRLLRDREREKDSRRRGRDDRDRERERENYERNQERKRDENKRREKRTKDARRSEIEDQEYDSDEKARKRLRTREARKRREKEREEDELDRVKEREEIDQKRADEERAKAEEQARIAAQEAAEAEKRKADQQQQQRALLQQQQALLQQQQKELQKNPVASPDAPTSPSAEENTTLRLGFNKRAKIAPVAGFMQDAADDEVVVKRKPLVMLDQPEHKDNIKGGAPGGRNVNEVQSVIDRIPTAKEDLFKIEVDWSLIEKHKIVDRKMKPWVTKKIIDYLGEEEKTLIDFIMGKITSHTSPEEILQQLALVLDDEADMFVVKMWRMLVYEMYTASAK